MIINRRSVTSRRARIVRKRLRRYKITTGFRQADRRTCPWSHETFGDFLTLRDGCLTGIETARKGMLEGPHTIQPTSPAILSR